MIMAQVQTLVLTRSDTLALVLTRSDGLALVLTRSDGLALSLYFPDPTYTHNAFHFSLHVIC